MAIETRAYPHKLTKAVCLVCGKERWIPIWRLSSPTYTGLCRECCPRFRRYRRRVGAENPSWRGGKVEHSPGGYIMVKAWGHPRAKKDGYVYEHILVWEEHHKQTLPAGWRVHHLNGIKFDNRPENLVAMPDSKHRSLIPLLKKRIRDLELQLSAVETSRREALE